MNEEMIISCLTHGQNCLTCGVAADLLEDHLRNVIKHLEMKVKDLEDRIGLVYKPTIEKQGEIYDI